MIKRIIVLLFIFFFGLVFPQAQNEIHINQILNYTNSKNIPKGSSINSLLLQPESGYLDPKTFTPIFQNKIPENYELISFNFTEKVLSKEYSSFYSPKLISSNYEIEIRSQEQNSVNKNSSILISCIRKKGADFYKLLSIDVTLRLKKNQHVNRKSSSFALNSFLSDGSKWFKLRNFKKGIHKIDYSFLLSNGIISSSVPSSTIHLFSNNQGLLSTINDNSRPDDLLQKSIYIDDGGDGVFSSGDFILFYLNSVHKEEWNGSNFTHTNHLYSDSAYFFINVSQKQSRILDSVNHLSENYSQTFNEYRDFSYLENDQINLLKSGSQWLGDVFDLNSYYSYNFPFSNIGDSSRVKVKLVSKSNYSTAFFNLSLFGQSRSIPISSSGSSYYSPVGKVVISEFDFYNNPGQSFDVNLYYDNNGSPSSKGYLDYIEVNCKRDLSVDNQQFDFLLSSNNGGANNWSKINLSNAGSVDMVWDITDLSSVKKVEFNKSGSNLNFVTNLDTAKHFIAISGSNFDIPQFFKEVDNQNLHAINTPEMVIITPIEFRQSAERLKLVHQNEGLNVVVVTDEEIYNEYSGGIPDATAIKQFLRMFYVRENGNPHTIPKYCLLFGDGTYDNKNILGHGNNFLPVFESSESMSVTNTYASDDYYAILSDGSSMQNTDLLNIGIGRLSFTTTQMADELIDKIENYITKADSMASSINCSNNLSSSVLGDWRNKVVLVSDDEDNNAYFDDIEIMANKIEGQKKEMNIIKIHSDAYAQQSSPVGEKIPAANAAIEQSVNDGALVVNYIGHGGETGWAHEGILDVPTINGWENTMNMPVFMTATCEFGRFDDHDRVSAGEYILLNSKGAGIGLFTTTRLVYANPNEDLNNYFYDTVFDLVNYKAQRLGDVYVGTKNKFALNNADPNFRKFALLGDPAIKLAIPELKVVIDSFNRDTVSALSEVVVYGHVEDQYSNRLSSFEGISYITFYDKKSSFSTLGTNPGSSVASFQMWKNIIYKGKSSVNNGVFSFTFKVPKDISYNYGLSRISLYAENGNNDASGYNDSLIIGGIDTTAAIDELGPDLEMYLNDENFISGGITNKQPLLVVAIFDENGVNTVGNGIGHDIELVIDGNQTNSIILNDFYESDLDTYKSGKINYELKDLEEGEHTLKIKVWDIYNNSSTKEITFNVVDDKELQLSHVLNYPNPFTTKTDFYFEHNQNCNFLDVSIQIYNVSGKVVKRINRRIHSEGFRSEGISWDARDDYGEKLAQGVYLYNIKVRNEQGISADKTESMFILK